MKIRTLVFLPALLTGAVAFAQGGTNPGPKVCPDKGVKQVGGEWQDSGFVACENGLISFGFSSAQIVWDDPVCPLMLTWIPPYHEIVGSPGTYTELKSSTQARAVFFSCADDNCVVTSHMHLPGDYDSYEVKPCTGGGDPG